jgi:hypothetical protein
MPDQGSSWKDTPDSLPRDASLHADPREVWGMVNLWVLATHVSIHLHVFVPESPCWTDAFGSSSWTPYASVWCVTSVPKNPVLQAWNE